MFGLFQRPKLEAEFRRSEAVSNEFTREIDFAGRLTLRNQGSDAELSAMEMMIVAGFRRIPLEVPPAWGLQLAKGATKSGRPAVDSSPSSHRSAPQAGELFVSANDQKRQTWQWRLPFKFELR